MKLVLRSLPVLCLTLAVLVYAADTWVLKKNVKVGDTRRYQVTAEVTMGDEKSTLTSQVIRKVVRVDTDGTFQEESVYTSTKYKSGTFEVDLGSRPSELSIYRSNGSIVELKSRGPIQSTVDPSTYRTNNLSLLRYSDKATGVGDSWTWEEKLNPKTGAVAYKCEYKVVKREKYQGIDALTIKATGRELVGSPAATSEATFTIDPSDGSLLKSVVNLKNATLPDSPTLVNMTVTAIRDLGTVTPRT